MTNMEDETVSVIDTSTNNVSVTIPVISNPWAIAFNPAGTKVYVVSNNLTSIIDTATNAVIDTLPAGGPRSGISFTPDGKKIYVVGNGTATVIDAENNKIKTTISDVGSIPVAFGQFIVPSTSPVFPVANFSSNVTSDCAPLTVQFNDVSQNATEWNWDFGDGTNSTKQNPIHTYFAAGNYTVILTAKNSAGSNTVTKQDYIIALKSEDIIIWGIVPLSLQFADQSENATSWKWYFGDGTNSTEQNPKHIYTKAGQYAVSVTVTNMAGSNTATYVGYVNVVNSMEPQSLLFQHFRCMEKCR